MVSGSLVIPLNPKLIDDAYERFTIDEGSSPIILLLGRLRKNTLIQSFPNQHHTPAQSHAKSVLNQSVLTLHSGQLSSL
jgi:hypothetical protein